MSKTELETGETMHSTIDIILMPTTKLDDDIFKALVTSFGSPLRAR
jgi:hypothetical protein